MPGGRPAAVRSYRGESRLAGSNQNTGKAGNTGSIRHALPAVFGQEWQPLGAPGHRRSPPRSPATAAHSLTSAARPADCGRKTHGAGRYLALPRAGSAGCAAARATRLRTTAPVGGTD
ncbi:hypothetical protein SCWH03_13820 [Streptomyces pacificus]|uniref:Uncharacterized protein n=1 Tax=Streptomyces pacificus TaxID=2705029 RepID=A0A6A0AR23_9ACTN|nr:hypothetical protein SCWH03_13820 [Streptomyces pacificus]